MPALSDAKEIERLVPIQQLFGALGIETNGRTRRGPCPLHGGSNPTAFAWRDDGRWHCFSCNAGGDKIALVQAVRKCSFRNALGFLAALAGVEFRSRRVSRREITQTRNRRERAERAAWQIADEIGRLRCYYTDGLHRAERIQKRVGEELLGLSTEAAQDPVWERLARLAPVCTFFFAAWNFIWDTKPDVLARFALASPTERRRFILDGVAP